MVVNKTSLVTFEDVSRSSAIGEGQNFEAVPVALLPLRYPVLTIHVAIACSFRVAATFS
jgi:hypothetical protein